MMLARCHWLSGFGTTHSEDYMLLQHLGTYDPPSPPSSCPAAGRKALITPAGKYGRWDSGSSLQPSLERLTFHPISLPSSRTRGRGAAPPRPKAEWRCAR